MLLSIPAFMFKIKSNLQHPIIIIIFFICLLHPRVESVYESRVKTSVSQCFQFTSGIRTAYQLQYPGCLWDFLHCSNCKAVCTKDKSICREWLFQQMQQGQWVKKEAEQILLPKTEFVFGCRKGCALEKNCKNLAKMLSNFYKVLTFFD